MQATLDAFALKPFTKALTCLSKYGDDLVIHAEHDQFSLCATNSSLSAYCRFVYGKRFFSRYSVGQRRTDGASSIGNAPDEDVKGQLMTKALLSILKHRTIDKAVERCELSIVEGAAPEEEQYGIEDDHDTLESKLIVRLHCKHGIVKTHRLLLQTPTSLLSPGSPDPATESRLTIGPRAIRDITEHFQGGRGGKNDPQLVWSFGHTEVEVKSLESSIDTKGKAQLSTELTISADEFDVYEVLSPPVTVAFHLREFNASVAFADSMSLCPDFRFTEPAAPLFIDIESDECNCLFVISTSQVHNAPTNAHIPPVPRNNPKKRLHEEEQEENGLDAGTASSSRAGEKFRKPMKAVQRTDAPSVPPSSRAQSAAQSVPPASFAPQTPVHSMRQPLTPNVDDNPGPSTRRMPLFLSSQPSRKASDPDPRPPSSQEDRLPLFYPMSQMSAVDEEVIRASGLGVENMNVDELEAMLEGDGEEVAFDFGSQTRPGDEVVPSSWQKDQDEGDYLEFLDDIEFEPTQAGDASEGHKTFRPLFED